MTLDERWQSVRRVVAIRLDNLGDVVMLGPALRRVQRTLPAAAITLMATPGGSQAAALLPWVDDVMVERVLWQDISGTWPLDPARELALVERIREHQFDAALIFTSFGQSPHPPAFACYLAGVPLRFGQSKEFGGGLLTQWVRPRPDSLHQVDRNLHLLASIGFPVTEEDTRLELAVPADARAAAERLLAGVGVNPHEPFVALAPGASAAARRYAPERYAEVAARLSAMGQPVVLLGSPREVELIGSLMAALAGAANVVSLAGQTTVPEMTAVIERCALLIANNSGPLHLAEALGRPMVILYSGTEYESQWRPRWAPARLLRRPTDCSPCYKFQCPYAMECLDIPADEVVAAAMEMMEQVNLSPLWPVSDRASIGVEASAGQSVSVG